MPVQLNNGRSSNVSSATAPDQTSSPLVAAVLANVEDGFGHGLSRSEFRELVAARGRSCDEAWVELRRRITGRRTQVDATLRLEALEAENARLRQLVSDQRAELDSLKLSRPRRG